MRKDRRRNHERAVLPFCGLCRRTMARCFAENPQFAEKECWRRDSPICRFADLPRKTAKRIECQSGSALDSQFCRFYRVYKYIPCGKTRKTGIGNCPLLGAAAERQNEKSRPHGQPKEADDEAPKTAHAVDGEHCAITRATSQRGEAGEIDSVGRGCDITSLRGHGSSLPPLKGRAREGAALQGRLSFF